MRFSYSAAVVKDNVSDDFLLFRRPEIPIEIAGPLGRSVIRALVDTGSDHTIFPSSVAAELGIVLSSNAITKGSGFGGQSLEFRTGLAQLQIHDGEETLSWQVELYFYDFLGPELESAVLGHSSFLDYFIAIFDGENSELELQPTSEMLELCSPQDTAG